MAGGVDASLFGWQTRRDRTAREREKIVKPVPAMIYCHPPGFICILSLACVSFILLPSRAKSQDLIMPKVRGNTSDATWASVRVDARKREREETGRP